MKTRICMCGDSVELTEPIPEVDADGKVMLVFICSNCGQRFLKERPKDIIIKE